MWNKHCIHIPLFHFDVYTCYSIYIFLLMPVSLSTCQYLCSPNIRSQLKGASVPGLFALAALGLISGDAVLTGAALAELRPYEHNPEYVHHVTFLRAAEATARVRAQKILGGG